MNEVFCVRLTNLVQEFHMTVAYAASDYESIQITVDDVARPGLQLSGYFDHFEAMRLQVLGKVEMTFLQRLSEGQRYAAFDRLFSYKIPALIIARGFHPGKQCLEMAKLHDVTVLCSPEPTSYLVSSLISFLKTSLAPRITRHGVLMEIYGEGILLTGESGIGKSEAAVELIKRGHRLIADDAVEIKRISNTSLIGSAPPLIRNYIELRGIGVINVARLFGVGAVKAENPIDLTVEVVSWSSEQSYDRLGMDEHFTELLGVPIPSITVPVTPGRNLAVILEVAAMNHRQKKMGYNAAKELTDQLNRQFDEAMRSGY